MALQVEEILEWKQLWIMELWQWCAAHVCILNQCTDAEPTTVNLLHSIPEANLELLWNVIANEENTALHKVNVVPCRGNLPLKMNS